jgi:site-specific recombinase XerD
MKGLRIMAIRQRASTASMATFVVLDRDWRVIGPVELYLEHLRQEGYSPNTVRAYAGGLAAWWSMLEDRDLSWQAIGVDDVARFIRSITRTVRDSAVELRSERAAAASTVNGAVAAVMGFYRYHALIGEVPTARKLYERIYGGPGDSRRRQSSLLGHLAGARAVRLVGRTRQTLSPPPFLNPQQIRVIKDEAATYDKQAQLWTGDLRMRLFWTLLEETGLRISEALLLQHGDWQPGTGATAAVEIWPREDPHRRLRSKSRHFRRIHISDELDDLYGEYLFKLAETGIDLADDLPVFVNLHRGQFGAPMRAETVYDWIERCKKRHQLLPKEWTPHWFRHTHATALLLAGVPSHVVQRRLGHADINTVFTTYAHVTDDAEMRTAADWKTIVAKWGQMP